MLVSQEFSHSHSAHLDLQFSLGSSAPKDIAAMSHPAHFKSSWETWTDGHVVNKGSQELGEPAVRAGFSKLICSKQEGRKHKWKRIKTGPNSLKFRGS